jgi:hypothetical protein
MYETRVSLSNRPMQKLIHVSARTQLLQLLGEMEGDVPSPSYFEWRESTIKTVAWTPEKRNPKASSFFQSFRRIFRRG